MPQKKRVITLSPQQLVRKLQEDVEAILKLQQTNHFRRGRPDEAESDEAADEYDDNYSDHDSAWERWANAMYNANNTMGGYLADVVKLVAAIQHMVEQEFPEEDSDE